MHDQVSRGQSACHWAALILSFTVAALPARGESRPATLTFLRDGKVVRTLDLDTLRRSCGARRIELEDPYYERHAVYLACPLGAVLTQGFGAPVSRDPGETFFLRARDGYARPATGARLSEDGGFLAFADAELTPSQDAGATGSLEPRFAPIDRRQVDPGPFYLVWTKPEQRDPERYPWPYQLVQIEAAAFEHEYPHTAPAGLPPDAPAWRGFATFKNQCMSCHSINAEGGKIGPDLNVPRSIVEYRPSEQIKAYVHDPSAFRYTNMPAHLNLSPAQLDELIAYFQAMSSRKHDPHRAP
jgi:mono/diheme cytochrome c family protein